MWANKKSNGFTIVELLIVIVVIGILAAVSLVAYGNIKDRSTYAKMRTELSSLNKAVQLYYAENGSYPITPAGASGQVCSGHWCGWLHSTGDDFIPGLSPKYVSVTPQLPVTYANSDTYLYRSPTGTDYKLIRLVNGTVSSSERTAMSDLMTTDCSAAINDSRWGYWNSSVSKCW